MRITICLVGQASVPVLIFLVWMALLTSCRGGGALPEPEQSDILAVTASAGSVRVYAGPDSADHGTTARVVSGGTGQAIVDADGSFTIDAQLGNGTVSQAIAITVEYTKEGAALQTNATVVEQSSSVTKPLFSTGAGPNDMIYANDSLYVANSLDNTVVRYGLDGAELAAASFPEFASPSFLGLAGSELYVVANGLNTLTGLDALNLAALAPPRESGISPGDLAFAGPGAPAIIGSAVYIPMAMIQEFGESTVYGMGALTYVEFPGPGGGSVNLSGYNGQRAYYDAASGHLLVTSTGQLQFDDSFMPFVTTDSYLDILDPEELGNPVAAVNLGRIGAGAITVSADGAIAYIGNALSGNLYKVDLESFVVLRGEDSPIVLTDEYTFISDVTFTPDGKYVLATSFNTDELYVIDPATDTVNPGPYPGPFDLSLDPELLAGCVNVEVAPKPGDPGRYSAFVLYAVGNAVARVDLF